MAKPIKVVRAGACRARRYDRDACNEEAEPGAVFDEVDTIDEIAPGVLALLRALPEGTRVCPQRGRRAAAISRLFIVASSGPTGP